MLSHNWRRGIVTAVAAGLLAAGASAQDGAQGDVTIKNKAVKNSQPTVEKTYRPVKPQLTDRDPFINQLHSSHLPDGPAPVIRPPKPDLDRTGDRQNLPAPVKNEVAAQEPAPPEIPAPEVTVNGIVSSGHSRHAIISTSVGTRMVTTGEKLGDYRVASIGANYVAFSYGSDRVFKVPMKSEF